MDKERFEMLHLGVYIGTKMIYARPCTRGEYNKGRGWELPKDENPDDEGYLVCYPDQPSNTDFLEGYVSWSPKDAFGEAYRGIAEGMNFGAAIFALKLGWKIARKGWNGKGMFLFLADTCDIDTRADLSCVKHLDGDIVLPTIVMKTVDDKFCVGWLASQTDMLAEDWVVVGCNEDKTEGVQK